MPDLHWDVLTSICHHVRDIPTILSISLACRTLRTIAARRLLNTQVVVLDALSITSFRQFIDADRAARLPFVRKLKIDLPWCWSSRCLTEDIRPGFIQFVLDLLEQATRLESLILPYPSSTYSGLDCDHRFLTAITRLSSLCELALEEGWTPMEEILGNTCSALKILRVHPGTSRSADPFLKCDVLFSLLQHIAPTLETLEVVAQVVSLSHNPRTNHVFPALRSFKVDTLTRMASIRTESLIQLFPALDGTLAFYSLYPTPNSVEEGREAHELNRASQLQRTWKSLDRVVGDVRLIYALGLVCPVRHLMLDGVSRHSKYQLDDILLNARPTHLKLTLDLARGIGVLENLLPPEVASELTHLVLFLSCANYNTITGEDERVAMQTLEWATLLDKVFTALNGTRLTHLRVVLQCCTDTWGSSNIPYSEDFVRAVRYFGEGPTALQVASNFMNALPTLQYVFLMTSGQSCLVLESRGDSPEHSWEDSGSSTTQDQSLCRGTNIQGGEWLSSSDWRSTWSTDGIPEQLASDMAKDLIEAEDLVLSKQDHFDLEENPLECAVGIWD